MKEKLYFSDNTILYFYKIKTFSKNSKFILLNIDSSILIEMEASQGALIEALLSHSGESFIDVYEKFNNIWTKEQFTNLLNQLSQSLLLKTEENDKIINRHKKAKPDGINTIRLVIAQKCNLACKYCYGDSGGYNNKGLMSMETAKKAIDFLFENAGDQRKLEIIFFGGEPLMNFQVVKDTVFYANKLAQERNKELKLSITTNGLMISDEISEFLIKNKFYVTLSIDGNKDVHDSNRIFPCGPGSYDETVQSIGKIRGKCNVIARGTVTRNGLNIIESFKHLESIGFDRIGLHTCVEMLDDNDYDILAKEYRKLVEIFSNLIENKEYNKAAKITNIVLLLRRIHNRSIKSNTCRAATSSLTIDKDGNIYPCHRFINEKDFNLGNIYKEFNLTKFNHIKNEIQVEHNKICDKCWAINYCGGGCRGQNFAMMNSISKPYYNNCKIQRAIIEELICLYSTLTEEDLTNIL
ncbi:MAG: SPASM domain-containing protein [Clostridiaceae bacterium]|nr:SPASM domain-containing protein [Clostridiaceae bacterium]